LITFPTVESAQHEPLLTDFLQHEAELLMAQFVALDAVLPAKNAANECEYECEFGRNGTTVAQ
jgi:hypothetical protein